MVYLARSDRQAGDSRVLAQKRRGGGSTYEQHESGLGVPCTLLSCGFTGWLARGFHFSEVFFFLTCPLQGFLFVAAPSPLPTHTQHFYSPPATPASFLRAALRSERKPIKKAPNFRLLPFYLFFFSFLALTYLPFGSVLVSLTLFLGSVFKFKRLSKSQLFLNKLFFF